MLRCNLLTASSPTPLSRREGAVCTARGTALSLDLLGQCVNCRRSKAPGREDHMLGLSNRSNNFRAVSFPGSSFRSATEGFFVMGTMVIGLKQVGTVDWF